MALPMPHRLFTVAEIYHLSEIGFFREDERIELIDGEIYEMPTPGIPHFTSVNALAELLFEALRGGSFMVSVQNPIMLSEQSLPLPDLSVYRRKEYTEVPGPDDVPLVIEVADSTITSDRRYKLPRYAAAGIAEAWLVDLNGQTIERHTEPSAKGYGVVAVGRRGEEMVSTIFPSLVIPVAAVIGANRRAAAGETQ